MATVFSGASAASDLNTNQNFTAGEIVTADDLQAVAYDAHLRAVSRLQAQMSFDDEPRVGIIRGFRGATRNSGAMTITVPSGMGIAKVATSEVNDSEHYVCFENEDSVVVTLAVGDGTHPRVDLIAVRPQEKFAAQELRSKRNTDGSLTTFNVYPNSYCYGDLVYVQGTAAASPSAPALDDANDIPLFYVYVPNGVTATNTCTLNPIMPLLSGKGFEQMELTLTVTVSAGHIALVVTATEDIPDNIVLGAWSETSTDQWRLKVYIPINYYRYPISYAMGASVDNAEFKITSYGGGPAPHIGVYEWNMDLYFSDGSATPVPPSGTQNVHVLITLPNSPTRAF